MGRFSREKKPRTLSTKHPRLKRKSGQQLFTDEKEARNDNPRKNKQRKEG